MIELLYSGNAKMFPGIMISVVSAAENTRRPLSVTLLTMDLRDEDPAFAPLTAEQAKAIEMAAGRKNPDVAVRVLDCAALYRERIAATSNAATSYSPYCFLRLFADRLPLPHALQVRASGVQGMRTLPARDRKGSFRRLSSL